MRYYISTNLDYRDLDRFMAIYDNLSTPCGIELLLNFDQEGFFETYERHKEHFKSLDMSVHEQIMGVEHMLSPSEKGYDTSWERFMTTLEMAVEIGAKSVVYHINNGTTTGEVEQRRKHALVELDRANAEAKKRGLELLVENVGVRAYDNSLYIEESQFITFARSIDNPILIDVGHAHANGWDLVKLIASLSDKIVCYHLHDNDGLGSKDSHYRIKKGTIDYDRLLQAIKEHTPYADIIIEYAPDEANSAMLDEDLAYLSEILGQ